MSRRNKTVRRKRTGYRGAITGARDAYLQPFLASSIWNTPIGSSAALVASGLAPALGDFQDRVRTDGVNISLSTSHPVKTLTTSDHYFAQSGAQVNVSGNYQIPNGTLVHVDPTLSEDGKMNGIAVLLAQDGTHYWEGQPLILTAGGDPSWPFTNPRPGDLYGAGLAGAHGGSGLSALGGTLRDWEWNGTAPIRHVLALNVNPGRFLSPSNGGFRYPATSADTGWDVPGSNNFYGGTTAATRLGSLLCLPANYDLTAVTNTQALRMATCLRDFGAYVVDATGTADVHQFSVEKTIEADFGAQPAAFHSQLMGIITDLQVVNNNTSTAIGGGGTPRVTPVGDLA